MWCNVGFTQSMIPLSQYLEENSGYSKDPITVSYIAKRCAAAYLYASTISLEDKKKTKQSLINSYQILFEFAANVLISKMNWNVQDAGEDVVNDVDKMMQYYIKDGKDFFTRTGTYTINNYIGNDLRFCKKLVEKIK